MSVNLKSLIGRLNGVSRGALEAAAGLCHSRTNYSVEIEHFLLKLVETPDTDLATILRHSELDASRLAKDVTRAVDRLKTGNSGALTMSDRIAAVGFAGMAPRLDRLRLRQGSLRPSPARAPDERNLARLAREISKDLSCDLRRVAKKNLPDIIAGSNEDREAGALGSGRGHRRPARAAETTQGRRPVLPGGKRRRSISSPSI